jgi:biopolymer transport protein ExbD
MKRPRYQPLEQGRADTKMTAMIDCVFQLLIFFIIAASKMVVEDSLPTRLPASGAVAAASLPPEVEELGRVVVYVKSKDGRTQFEVNGTPYEDIERLRGLLVQLAKEAPEIPVILDIEPLVSMGSVIDVYDLCRLAGFETINFATSKWAEGIGRKAEGGRNESLSDGFI